MSMHRQTPRLGSADCCFIKFMNGVLRMIHPASTSPSPHVPPPSPSCLLSDANRLLPVQGWTPLHYATAAHSTEAIQLLVSGGADVNAQDLEVTSCWCSAQVIKRVLPWLMLQLQLCVFISMPLHNMAHVIHALAHKMIYPYKYYASCSCMPATSTVLTAITQAVTVG